MLQGPMFVSINAIILVATEQYTWSVVDLRPLISQSYSIVAPYPLTPTRVPPSTNTSDINDIRPWIENIAHNMCQDMSGIIPYPTTFKACKQGYR